MNFKLQNILNHLMKFLYTPFSPSQTMNHLSSILRLYLLSSAAILINQVTAMISQLHVQGPLCGRLILKYILHHLMK